MNDSFVLVAQTGEFFRREIVAMDESYVQGIAGRKPVQGGENGRVFR
jgi:hypothetical protein